MKNIPQLQLVVVFDPGSPKKTVPQSSSSASSLPAWFSPSRLWDGHDFVSPLKLSLIVGAFRTARQTVVVPAGGVVLRLGLFREVIRWLSTPILLGWIAPVIK